MKMDCCLVASCMFLRYIIINIAKISIYKFSRTVDGYFCRKNVEDIVLNDNPLMAVTLASTK